MKALKLSVLAIAVVFATVTLVTYARAHDKEDTGHHKLTITIVYDDVTDKEAADIAQRVNAANSGACKIDVHREKIDNTLQIWDGTGSNIYVLPDPNGLMFTPN